MKKILGRIMYNLVRMPLGSIGRIIYRVKLTGKEYIPKQGAFILAPNHSTNLDPPFIGSFLPYRADMYYMAKEELFSSKIIGWVLRMVNAFPVSRGKGDLGAFKTAMEILAKGHALLIFPEGTRRKKNKLVRPQKGIALIASKTKVPVIPMKIENLEKWYLLKKLYIKFGEPMFIDENVDYEESSRMILDRIECL